MAVTQFLWSLVVAVAVLSFAILVWWELRREQPTKQTSLNTVSTGFGAKTGDIALTSKGEVPIRADVNKIELGPLTQTKKIGASYEDGKKKLKLLFVGR